MRLLTRAEGEQGKQHSLGALQAPPSKRAELLLLWQIKGHEEKEPDVLSHPTVSQTGSFHLQIRFKKNRWQMALITLQHRIKY